MAAGPLPACDCGTLLLLVPLPQLDAPGGPDLLHAAGARQTAQVRGQGHGTCWGETAPPARAPNLSHQGTQGAGLGWPHAGAETQDLRPLALAAFTGCFQGKSAPEVAAIGGHPKHKTPSS